MGLKVLAAQVQKFPTRTAAEILFGIFFALPVIYLGSDAIGYFEAVFDALPVLGIALVPWFWFYPLLVFGFSAYLFFAAFFLLHTVFRRKRFPRASKVFGILLPYAAMLFLAYVATGLSQVYTKPYLWMRPPVSVGAPGVLLDGSGFPLKYYFYYPEQSGFFGSSVTPEVLLGPLLADMGFYFIFFLLLRSYLLRMHARRKKELAHSVHE
jgi:hypothetical protein